LALEGAVHALFPLEFAGEVIHIVRRIPDQISLSGGASWRDGRVAEGGGLLNRKPHPGKISGKAQENARPLYQIPLPKNS